MQQFKKQISPGWCGSVDWALACKQKGRWFNSRSGYMPGLRARSPGGGVQKGVPHTNVSLTHRCFSLSLPLSKNNWKKFKKIKSKSVCAHWPHENSQLHCQMSKEHYRTVCAVWHGLCLNVYVVTHMYGTANTQNKNQQLTSYEDGAGQGWEAWQNEGSTCFFRIVWNFIVKT